MGYPKRESTDSSMLDAEAVRECAARFSIAGLGFGDGTVELAREIGALEIGEIMVHSTGSVALRYIGGRVVYG